MSTLQELNNQKLKQFSEALTQVFGASLKITGSDSETGQQNGPVKAVNCIQPDSEVPHQWQLDLQNVQVTGLEVDVHGTVEAVSAASVERSLSVAIEVANQKAAVDDLNNQLACFVEQVSDDLEEAAWFRNMAEQVAACRADDPVEELCGRILPQLRSLLHAKSVFVVRDSESSDADTVTIAMNTDEESQHQSEQICHRLVHRFKDNYQRPVIRNAEFPLGNTIDQADIPDISGFIIVRIGSDEQHYGWLVAMDRLDTINAHVQSRCSESEFGTHEATLMGSAAVLLATHAANRSLFDEQEETLFGVVTAMVNALDARDPYTRGHSHRVALIGKQLGLQMGMTEEEAEDIHLAGLLHDIGKIGVSDHVLLKDGPLNQAERQQIEQHTTIGHSILAPVRQLDHILPGVLHHHERIDGTGYPGKLAGATIPMAGRILAVADAYDAMTTTRPYRNAMPIEKAEHILLEGIGTHWDEEVVVAFFSAKNEIRAIYAQDEHHESNQSESGQSQSILQYGRFEDVSQGVSLTQPAMAKDL